MENTIGVSCALGAALVWACAMVLFRKSGEQVPPLALNLFKNMVAIVLLAATLGIMGEGFAVLAPFPARDFWILAASGILGIAVADTLFFYGLNLCGVGIISIVDCLYSPFIIFFAFLLLGETLAPLQYLGAGLILSAVFIASRHKPPEDRTRGQMIAGVFFGAAAMGTMGLAIVMSKPVLNGFPVVWATTIRLVAGEAALFIFILALPVRRALLSAFKPSHTWKTSLPGAVLGAYLSCILWICGFKYTDASVAAVLNQTSTIFAIVLAAFFLKESFTRRKLAAVALAMIGILPVMLCGDSNVLFTEGDGRIDVSIRGKPFTSYLFGEDLAKPILHPLLSPSGIAVNRAFPLARAEGESEDHPHHAGLFFTYDRVNDDGFWNNTAPPPQIRHEKVTEMTGGPGRGVLSCVMHWVGKEGRALLEEKRKMVFLAGDRENVIDFTIDLIALDEKVSFGDTKEGMFAIRVAPWLKEKGGTGAYLSSNGRRREKEVWGRRARWVRLEGEKEELTIGIAILNHPSSVNYPTYWHARGYGLFSANPLGQLAFDKARKVPDAEPFALTLEPGEKARFRFRVIVYEGPRTAEELEARFREFAADAGDETASPPAVEEPDE